MTYVVSTWLGATSTGSSYVLYSSICNAKKHSFLLGILPQNSINWRFTMEFGGLVIWKLSRHTVGRDEGGLRLMLHSWMVWKLRPVKEKDLWVSPMRWRERKEQLPSLVRWKWELAADRLVSLLSYSHPYPLLHSQWQILAVSWDFLSYSYLRFPLVTPLAQDGLGCHTVCI